MTQDLALAVMAGLSRRPRRLSSRFFYDARGSALFVAITQTPEYYLTAAEREIFTTHSGELVRAFALADAPFELIELGAGDGHKTALLLEALSQHTFTYVPVDISGDALQDLVSNLKIRFPDLAVHALQEEYFAALRQLRPETRKVVLFLGSNLGNLSDEEATRFLAQLADRLQPGDCVLLGLDLIKPARLVLPAYNDAAGLTRDFNLNLLGRINRELGADFDLAQWEHQPSYDEAEGVARSALVSRIRQQVRVAALQETFTFEAGEPIHTEISRKYSQAILQNILSGTGLVLEQVFYDHRGYFGDFLLRKPDS
jgi:dimethylhistidine N-methyltransferase